MHIIIDHTSWKNNPIRTSTVGVSQKRSAPNFLGVKIKMGNLIYFTTYHLRVPYIGVHETMGANLYVLIFLGRTVCPSEIDTGDFPGIFH